MCARTKLLAAAEKEWGWVGGGSRFPPPTRSVVYMTCVARAPNKYHFIERMLLNICNVCTAYVCLSRGLLIVTHRSGEEKTRVSAYLRIAYRYMCSSKVAVEVI